MLHQSPGLGSDEAKMLCPLLLGLTLRASLRFAFVILNLPNRNKSSINAFRQGTIMAVFNLPSQHQTTVLEPHGRSPRPWYYFLGTFASGYFYCPASRKAMSSVAFVDLTLVRAGFLDYLSAHPILLVMCFC